MATALNVIERALREIGVIQSGESPSATEAQDALTSLNQMLHGWRLKSVNLNHIDLVLIDTLPYPQDHEDPIVYNLAARLGQEYGVSIKPVTAALASDSFRSIQNYYADPQDSTFDDALNPVYGQNRFYL